MGFLEQLDDTINLPIVHYHKFLISYKKNSNDIYAFCEGDVDLSYYCEQIERICPGRVVHKCPAGGKNNVLQIHGFINWDNYQKDRVLFFVDRDLSYWANEPQEYDTNVYVTDGYSFENDAVNLHMFIKLLEDLYGFANYSSNEKKRITRLYSEKWEAFVSGSYELMGYTLHMYHAHKHTAKYLNIRKCLNIGESHIWKNNIGNLSYEDYIKSQLKIEDNDLSQTIQKYKERFICDDTHYCIRGKWCLDFMIILMDYVLENGEEFAPSLYKGMAKKPKRIVELTSRGAMAIIAPRMIPAESLIRFLMANVGNNNA